MTSQRSKEQGIYEEDAVAPSVLNAGLGWVDCKDELPKLWERVVIAYQGMLSIGYLVDRDDVKGGKPWVIDGCSGGPNWYAQRPSHWYRGLEVPNVKLRGAALLRRPSRTQG